MILPWVPPFCADASMLSLLSLAMVKGEIGYAGIRKLPAGVCPTPVTRGGVMPQ